MEGYEIIDAINLLFNFGIPILIIFGLGLLAGTATEKRHIEGLELREQTFAMKDFIVSDLRFLPAGWNADQGTLVTGQAVIASDPFKRFAAGLIRLVGGKIGVYERLMDRARREATLRMLEQARSLGCNTVWCYRQETSTIGGGPETRGQVMAEVFVFGTAYQVSTTESV